MIASKRLHIDDFHHLNVSRHGDAFVIRFRRPGLLTNEFVVRGVGEEFSVLADRPACRKVIVDFVGVEDLSSYMMGRLVLLRKLMAAKQGQMVLRGLSDDVREFFDETLLSELFEIAEPALESRLQPASLEQAG